MSCSEAIIALKSNLGRDGAVVLSGSQTRGLIGEHAQSAFEAFAKSWEHLGPDRYMADGGRYRQRKHAVFAYGPDGLIRQAHQPHYQSRDYNQLNGGVQRWFEPVTEADTQSPVLLRLVDLCAGLFGLDDGRIWHTEMHQFRIEPVVDGEGRPTPEGMHRDGVDWVAVILIDRINVSEGVTRIEGAEAALPEAFTLSEPLDAVFLDDHRVRHGVTPIHLTDPARPGHRDVLVLTFAA